MATFSDFLSRQKKDDIEFLEDDPISGNLVLAFSLGGRKQYKLSAAEEGSCFHARATTKKEVSTKKRSQAAFRAAVVRRYGGKRCALCDAPSEVIEAAHIVTVSENGSDDSGNGLLLCRNHHALFDMGKWCLEPSSLEVIPANGYDLQSLGVQRPNASHLRVLPNQDALDWRWGEFQHQQPKTVA